MAKRKSKSTAAGTYITQNAQGNYVMVGANGHRYSLSINDAIRLQKTGVPYKATARNPKQVRKPKRLSKAQMNKIAARARHLSTLAFPTGRPWTDADRKKFIDASDRWDAAHNPAAALGSTFVRAKVRRLPNGRIHLMILAPPPRKQKRAVRRRKR